MFSKKKVNRERMRAHVTNSRRGPSQCIHTKSPHCTHCTISECLVILSVIPIKLGEGENREAERQTRTKNNNSPWKYKKLLMFTPYLRTAPWEKGTDSFLSLQIFCRRANQYQELNYRVLLFKFACFKESAG